MKGHPERMAFFVYLQTIKRTIIIAAGGEGQRMKTDLPKQFIELDGRMNKLPMPALRPFWCR